MTAASFRLSVSRHRIRVSTDVHFLSVGQIRERYGVSAMWIWRHMRDHGFPKPVRFGGPTSARHWLISDIEQWERQRSNRLSNIPSALRTHTKE